MLTARTHGCAERGHVHRRRYFSDTEAIESCFGTSQLQFNVMSFGVRLVKLFAEAGNFGGVGCLKLLDSLKRLGEFQRVSLAGSPGSGDFLGVRG